MPATVSDQDTRADSRTLVRLGWVAGLGAGWFVVAVLLLHALKSADYNFSAQTVSELAVGRYGFLMTSAFIALGIGELALAVGLWRAAGARFAPILQVVGGTSISPPRSSRLTCWERRARPTEQSTTARERSARCS